MNNITRRYAEHVNNRGNKMLSSAMQMIMVQGKSPIDNLIEQHRRMSESMFSERFEKELKEEVKEAVSKEIRDYLKR